MLSNRVKVVDAALFALIHNPLLSVFLTFSPEMLSVGVAVAVEPTLKVYEVPAPPADWMVALVLLAVSVPSMASVVPAPMASLPAAAMVSAPVPETLSPPEKVCVPVPALYDPPMVAGLLVDEQVTLPLVLVNVVPELVAKLPEAVNPPVLLVKLPPVRLKLATEMAASPPVNVPALWL